MSAGGAPTIFDKEKADYICEQLATSHKSLRSICKEEGMPSVRTVLYWLTKGDDPESDPIYKEFLRQYACARENQADFLAEEIIEISEHTEEDHTAFTGGNVVNRDKLRIDARKWVAAKLKPKKYGDRVDLTSNGKSLSGPMLVEIVKSDDSEA